VLTPALLPQRPLVFAHRGGAALAPENTLPAFDRGLSLGADGLEMDVRLSRDGVVVVHHDATLERTTNGRGALSDHTAAELDQLDAAYQFTLDGTFPMRGRGLRIPRLAHVLARYPASRHVVELKMDSPELARATIDAIREAGAVDRISIGSFHASAIATARAYEPRIQTGASTEEIRRQLMPGWFRRRKRPQAFQTLQVPESWTGVRIVSPGFVARAHEAGIAVWVWTVNQEDDIRRLLDWGVDGIMTDRPDVAVPAVRAWYQERT
jgi:glycerophosphoryl diester phosphodiesterase